MWRLFAVGVIFMCCPPWARAEDSTKDVAPFGLTWGMSVDAAKAREITLADAPNKDFGASFIATKLPKVLTDTDSVFLSFGYNDKLWRVVAVSRDFKDDPYGAALKARFGELASLLAEKYGKGQAHQTIESRLYTKAEEFLMGIHTGRSWWYNNYDTPLLSVQLIIGASDFSTGYWRIIFENKLLRANFEQGKKSHEKDAL